MTDNDEPVVALTEKIVIFCSLLAGLPLTQLDKEFLGFRRFVWLGSSVLGLISLCCLDPTSSTATTIDSISFALLSTSLVPHLIQLIKDQTWLGIGVLPPFFMVTYQSTQTQIDQTSEEYWQVRCFLHLFAYTLPYLNHLPSPPSEKNDDDDNDDQEEEEEQEEKNSTANTPSTTKSTKAKKSNSRTNNKKKR